MAESRSETQLVAFRFWESVAAPPDTRAEIRYFGMIKRIPVAAFPRDPVELRRLAMEWDESPESMRRSLPGSVPTSMQGWEPLPNGTVERFEAFDRENGDLLVYWRVPCRRK
jgi:hypothetical protein